MAKILISGFYGFGNLGDEAILETMLKRIKKIPPVSEITVLSNNPELTSKDYSVKAVSRKSFFGVIKAISKCDVLISGGGSLLQDVTSGKSIFYYFFIIAMGVLMRKRVMLYSHGIGPITKASNAAIAKFLLNRVDCITVREKNSMNDLLDMGVSDKLITVTADPVIDISGAVKENGKDRLLSFREFDPKKRTIGFSIRTKDFKDDKLYDDFKLLVAELLDEFNVVMLPFYITEDLDVALNVKKDQPGVIVVDRKLGTHDTLDLMMNFDVLVGTRLHSLIFGAVCGIPLIGMSYDPKIDYFLETIGQKPALDISSFDRESIKNEIRMVLDESGRIRSDLALKVETLRKSLDRNDELLQSLSERLQMRP